jgi:hypothetical protein
MDIPLALIADYAATDAVGKLNIIGAFNRISPAAFPYVHPLMHLVIKLQPDRGEYEDDRFARADLVNQDGQLLLRMEARFRVPRPPDHTETDMNIILAMVGVPFEQPGTYEFRIYIDKEQKRTVPVYLTLREPAAS